MFLYNKKEGGVNDGKAIRKSAERKRPIEIIYVKKDNAVSQRTILVYGVTDTYIKAYCLKRSSHAFSSWIPS